MVLGTIMWLVAVAAAIWTIYHVWTQNKQDSQGMKIVWTVLAVFFSIITAIVYYFVRAR